MPRFRSLRMAFAAAVLATMVLPAHGQGSQGQGQGRGQSQGQGQGQEQGQGQGQEQGQDQGQGQGQGQGGQGPGSSPPGQGSGGGGGPGGEEAGSDGDFALDAVRDERALPLADILATARQTVPGEVIDARLVTIRGFLVYEVKSMTGDGHVGRSYYYARSGRKVGTD